MRHLGERGEGAASSQSARCNGAVASPSLALVFPLVGATSWRMHDSVRDDYAFACLAEGDSAQYLVCFPLRFLVSVWDGSSPVDQIAEWDDVGPAPECSCTKAVDQGAMEGTSVFQALRAQPRQCGVPRPVDAAAHARACILGQGPVVWWWCATQ